MVFKNQDLDYRYVHGYKGTTEPRFSQRSSRKYMYVYLPTINIQPNIFLYLSTWISVKVNMGVLIPLTLNQHHVLPLLIFSFFHLQWEPWLSLSMIYLFIYHPVCICVYIHYSLCIYTTVHCLCAVLFIFSLHYTVRIFFLQSYWGRGPHFFPIFFRVVLPFTGLCPYPKYFLKFE